MYPTKDSGFNTNGLGGSELQMLGGTESWDKRCNVKKKNMLAVYGPNYD